MSNPERSEPFATLSETESEQPASERLPAVTPDRQSEPPESGGLVKPSPRSSIRPAPADYRPRSDRPPRSPMVVVYSGDSDRPPPHWDVDEPSERPTIAHFAPVPREPFPLAEDLPLPEAGNEQARRSMPSPADGDTAMGAATLRLSTWPSPPDDSADTTRSSAKSASNKARWRGSFVALGVVAIAWFGLALPSAPERPPDVASSTPASTTTSPPTVESAPAPLAPLIAAEAPPPARTATPGPAEGAPAPPPSAESAKFYRVTLEVFPADANVVRRGMRQPGPPYSFKVPRGKAVSIEVAKKGFVTRKVVLDGSESTVVVGLFRKSLRRRGDPAPSSKSSARHDSSSRVGSGL